jgi:hypothetical protein
MVQDFTDGFGNFLRTRVEGAGAQPTQNRISGDRPSSIDIRRMFLQA